jgi:hypothetical protein
LSAAQRLLDDFRRADGRTDLGSVVRNLRDNVKDLAKAHAAIEEVIADVRRQIDTLPPERHRKNRR